MAVVLLDILSHLLTFLSILSIPHFAMAAPVDPRQSQPPNNTVGDGAEGGVPASAIQQSTSELPVYVRDYGLLAHQLIILRILNWPAPLVWLSNSERYMPSDIASQVANTIPKINGAPVAQAPSPLTLNNLDQLNAQGGKDIWLTSREGIPAYPKWFNGVTPDGNRKTNGATTAAIVTVDKGNGNLDAFYFYFFAFNRGNTVLGQEFGSHVGDWEHNMIRFQNGVPQAVYFSQHASSQSFTYNAVEKNGIRPVAYIAEGSHAVYATTGYARRYSMNDGLLTFRSTHDHTIPRLNLPGGLVEDHCDRGKLWDPVLSTYSYRYDRASQKFSPYDPGFPVNWLYFLGRWGDAAPPKGSEGQFEIFGQKRYSGGPTGPIDKRLDRENMSGVKNDNWVRPFLTP